MNEPRQKTIRSTTVSRKHNHGTYEYVTLNIPRAVSQADARELLTFKAEADRWELDRSVLYEGGNRKVRLKRRIIRVSRTA